MVRERKRERERKILRETERERESLWCARVQTVSSVKKFNHCLIFTSFPHKILSDFDVCWCKGSVAEKIFTPLVEKIKGQGGKVRFFFVLQGYVLQHSR